MSLMSAPARNGPLKLGCSPSFSPFFGGTRTAVIKRASRSRWISVKPRLRKPLAPRDSGSRRLFFESLEERQVLSTLAVTSAVAGQLTITDLNDLVNKDDSLAMSFNAGNYEFQQGGDAVLDLPMPIPGVLIAGNKLIVDATLFDDFDIEMLNAGDSVAVNSVGPTPLDRFKVANGTTQLSEDVSTTADQTYNSDVLLAADVQLAAANVVFDRTMNGNNHSLDIVGNAVFGDATADLVTGITTLTVSGTTAIFTDTITTGGGQEYKAM